VHHHDDVGAGVEGGGDRVDDVARQLGIRALERHLGIVGRHDDRQPLSVDQVPILLSGPVRDAQRMYFRRSSSSRMFFSRSRTSAASTPMLPSLPSRASGSS
jgi:hypothetical protein